MKNISIISNNNDGFILVMALMSLVLLSLLGVTALTTSIYEMNLSGNEKVHEEDFDYSESAAYSESAKLGFVTDTNAGHKWYQVVDPEDKNKALYPPITGSYFDPGGDMLSVPTLIKDDDSTTWPMANLINSIDNDDDDFDYAYLVTYLFADTAPKEYGSEFSAYQFRVNSRRSQDIEVGGMKIGAKSTI